ncbi:Protein of unknown function (DUF2846) [Mariprofundus ferrinatatus]|uniref:DUF2846 domain-containing protein n=1 Tax=Mariprofundus ferrinatatus TaxID=1921087 RepID=A0A2K8L563_9PROT|nr:DUF2846 domain-containing protein [Mariprofundus ferrinatatus]ATX82455.1 Protein of unknown function (DUF2846) [Mariprofundus ferrinatatus]
MSGSRLISRAVIIGLILFTAGCISLGEKFKPVALSDQSKALVILYRPADLCNLTDPLYFLANGEDVATLGNNAYTHVQATPGMYVIEIKNMLTRYTQFDQGREIFEFEAGNTYYIKYHRICKLFAPDTNFVDAIDQDIALKELSKMGYSKPIIELLTNPKQY